MATPFPTVVAYHDPVKNRYQRQFVRARIHGEQAYGVIKRRFRALQHLPFRSLTKCSRVIDVLLSIHNFILSQDDVDEISFL